MPISLTHLKMQLKVEKVVFHSLDLSLYQVSAVVGGQELLVTDDDGKPLRDHSLHGLQKHFKAVRAESHVLRQQSAYDEMVGHNHSAADNTMEIPIAINPMV
ncbi:DUF6482 family protein [Veronia pacifica]|uniref:Na(+)-translocating NADH-quinone reductase subunit B n=1 Tax=Veronia pacifica TaxID=1080227 RepID=A0A1C3ES42_9GAMM|nr:DUF6482 family protein [Veronia pacifica]ODA36056.1 hypothetical protein A8L45_00140 [Veronia pacifica]